jgi:hypothetical protein
MGECPANLKTYKTGHFNIFSSPAGLCKDGKVDVHEGYDCNNVDLMSYFSNKDLGSLHNANDIWGIQIGESYLAIVGHEGREGRRVLGIF